ncbi:hypothetical protein Nhal_1661 [Nitrosococcus halophilus Nc 4]|uniref:HMA domain-containing protein n=1 Tax=Nitrosococcus halophilus (strain Nc4) TaxID=472759 RepID=D5C2D2_NITHN|nr:heavy-metal-associated domain-containing protein [Nitrosococcus halophilus]ADE14791.1 hypothetical protein Nhal_1661 [Nitrosococcus halophilus Nc 4]
MKQAVLIFLGVFLLGAGALASETTYHLKVDGISCPFCAYGIEKAFSQLEGIKIAQTDLEKGVVVVTMEEGKSLDEATARKVVVKTGFTLRGFKKVPKP